VAGAGTSNAMTFGLRYEFRPANRCTFQFTGTYLHGDRFIINQRADSSIPRAQRPEPFTSDLALVEIAMQLRLTGGKTWHGFAPYLGRAGARVRREFSGDTTKSGYLFGTKLTPAFMTACAGIPPGG